MKRLIVLPLPAASRPSKITTKRRPGILHPVLQLEQLDLELPFLVIVFLTAQAFGVGVILPPGVHHAPVRVAEHRVILV